MLRRYMVANVASTVVLYAGAWALIPSASSVSRLISENFESFVMGHTFLGPVLNRVITIAADAAGWLPV